jgi:hypothetical protein
MALAALGDGRYRGELNEHWTIGPKVHGGAMLALCANAARLEHAGGVEPIGPGHPMAGNVHLAHGCDIRPSLTTMAPRSDAGAPVIEYWVRPRDAAPDVLFALLCGDVSAPVTSGVNRFGWAPTVQLTAYLRARPADGWLRVICTSTQIGQEWFDEDHVVVDCEGRIIVQSRQLAMVPAA